MIDLFGKPVAFTLASALYDVGDRHPPRSAERAAYYARAAEAQRREDEREARRQRAAERKARDVERARAPR